MKLMSCLSKSVLAAAASIALVGSAAAAGPLDLSSGSTSFGGTPAAGSFTDTFTFALAVPSILSGSVVAVVNGSQDVDFTSISVSGPSGTFAFTNVLPDPIEAWGLTATPTLAPGNYTLTLVGTNSASVGSWAGNLGVTPVPVPEPATYGLLLAGLVAVGTAARRRAR